MNASGDSISYGYYQLKYYSLNVINFYLHELFKIV